MNENNENNEIFSIVENFIKNDYKFGYSFEFINTYEDIINYWNIWYINNKEDDDSNKELLCNKNIESNLDSAIKDELEIIFNTHFNSSDNHMILFYISYSENILIKIKSIKTENKYECPYWTLKISNKKLLDTMKEHNIIKNQISVLIYN